MDAPGVDDEAIAAQLHRELNAFTRRAARGDLPLRKRRRKDGSSPGDSGHPSSSAPTRSPAASSSGEHAERTRSGGEELQEAQGTSQPGGRRGGGGGVGHGASRFAPEPPSWYAALADAAATSAKRRAAAAAQRPLAAQPDADGQQAARQPAGDDPAQKGTPDQGSGSARSIKCFCAGVRWGVSLSADRAKDRSALAAAVREALGGADVKACRDDCHVLMLDSSGAVTSFPAGSAISQGAWDPAAATAVRIYVR
jgi:hypothetical protein